jgi:cell division protein FtsQ
MAKLKTMDADAYPPEALVDEEAKYLRRQKPVEIKRRKFGKRAWRTYFRVLVISIAMIAGAGLLYVAGDFLFASPRLALLHPQQIELSGAQHVSRGAVLEIFAPDRGRSILRIPLGQRRQQLEAIPWVEHATVRRALPNRLQVEIVERTPVAFLRQATELSLVDGSGVILEKPIEGDFQFPVVTGLTAQMTAEDREQRMKMFTDFMQQIDVPRPGASAQVSEVDLSDAAGLRATLTGLPAPGSAAQGMDQGPLLVLFGDRDFQNKFRLLLDNIAQWRAAAGRVESVDLRFSREVVVNPESKTPSARKLKLASPAKTKR